MASAMFATAVAVWDAIGGEVVVFFTTLACALALRGIAAGRRVPLEKTLKEGHASAAAAVAASSPCVARRADVARELGRFVDRIAEGVHKQPSFRTATEALDHYQTDWLPRLRGEGPSILVLVRHAKHSLLDFYWALVNSAIRVRRHHLVEVLVDDMADVGVVRTLPFYESAMKQLAVQKQYHLALSLYDRLAADGLQPSVTTYSCLIAFAMEVGEYERAVGFFEQLSTSTTPSLHAYMSVLRVHSRRQDFAAAVSLLREMKRRHVAMDSLALNVVLAVGVANDELDAVEQLMVEAAASEPPICDVVSYNTLLKGYARRGMYDMASRLLGLMRARGVAPNPITFHTAMDAAVRAGRPDDAWMLLAEFRAARLRPDKFTCSTMAKALASGPTEAKVMCMLEILRDADDVGLRAMLPTLYEATFMAALATPRPCGGRSLAAIVEARMLAQEVEPGPKLHRMIFNTLHSRRGAGVG